MLIPFILMPQYISFRLFIDERMGRKYVEFENIDFSQSYEESGPSTPIFFILSPGVDPLKVLCSGLFSLNHMPPAKKGSCVDMIFFRVYVNK